MNGYTSLCDQFSAIFNTKSKISHGVCSVSLHRNFSVTVQGRTTTSVVPVSVSFEALDQNGNALNLAEIAILEKEVPSFMYSVVQHGLIVSALHNHWIFVNPNILYMHIQSVEPPLQFGRKLVNAFSALSSYPKS
ncbi:DUF1259 domain-containing protein [Lederbergia wuyishanensis]|uniref:Methyltransferase n=1 Tax=Lederbergia wuyishanensis TaxID=1347903 RepID=A0ABU0D404_9BACI|nr:DUF1259 domain-containing protein [Lederbergia wuyishanensis]MCJ8007731.1 DUF1259 domain-containing protein [Lederbergia wuyishanensis]MDQ0343106.1 hypothetical protein [Lederbergia wuyishanensis]